MTLLTIVLFSDLSDQFRRLTFQDFSNALMCFCVLVCLYNFCMYYLHVFCTVGLYVKCFNAMYLFILYFKALI